MFRPLRMAAFAAGVLAAGSAAAIDLTVTHFGTGMYGVPFAVARDKGWFQRLLHGSVMEYVVHHSPCPVLVVRHAHSD